jgi:hypothetical protein
VVAVVLIMLAVVVDQRQRLLPVLVREVLILMCMELRHLQTVEVVEGGVRIQDVPVVPESFSLPILHKYSKIIKWFFVLSTTR